MALIWASFTSKEAEAATTRSARRAIPQLASPTEVLRGWHGFAVPPPEKLVVSRTDNYLQCNQTISVTNSLEKKSFPTYLL